VPEHHRDVPELLAPAQRHEQQRGGVEALDELRGDVAGRPGVGDRIGAAGRDDAGGARRPLVEREAVVGALRAGEARLGRRAVLGDLLEVDLVGVERAAQRRDQAGRDVPGIGRVRRQAGQAGDGALNGGRPWGM
jgi:hypothetical protein